VVSFSKWGRTIALAGSFCLVVGGVVMIVAYTNQYRYPLSIYAWIVSVLIAVFFYYPLPGPFKPMHIVAHLNYFLNSFLFISLSVFCFFDLPTHLGGFCLAIAGIWYFIAAVRKEKKMTLKEINGAGGARE